MILTSSHLEFREKVRAFATRYIEPNAKKIDETQEFCSANIQALAREGYLGMLVPKEYDGSGYDTLSYIIAVEELSRVCGSTGITVAAHNSLASYPIYRFGTEAQKRKYLPDLASGRRLGAFGLTEPQAGSDASATKSVAVLQNGTYILNGQKCWITNASVAETFVITARTSPGTGPEGISAFILEKGMPGFSVGKKENKMGLRGSDTAFLHFTDVPVPKENLLGPPGEGFKQFMRTLDGGRISIGAMALGIAQGAFECALNYAQNRIQFDRPIAAFQAIQWKMADMATWLEAARNLTYTAASLKDQGKRTTKESAMAKLFASEIGRKVCYQAIQILGAAGYSNAYPVDRMYRDVKLCEIGEGTSEIQRMVIARELLK